MVLWSAVGRTIRPTMQPTPRRKPPVSTTRHRLALLATIASAVVLGGAAPAGAATTVLSTRELWQVAAGRSLLVVLLAA